MGMQGLQYVESTLQAYQRDTNLNPLIQFPLELNFDVIGVLIDERSDDYIVGANTALPKFNGEAGSEWSASATRSATSCDRAARAWSIGTTAGLRLHDLHKMS